MKQLVWFVIGVAAGFAAAHQVNRTEKGRRVFDDLNRRGQEFGGAVTEGFRERSAEIRDAIEDLQGELRDSGRQA